MNAPSLVEEIAPAKINLYLHIGGARADGLHDLTSLFVFAVDGDVVRASGQEALSLKIDGPFAPALANEPVESNLVWRAAEMLRERKGIKTGAAIILQKKLPVAAGIGGGSADAAAALRALIRLWSVSISDQDLHEIAFQLGADVPACLSRSPVHVSGAGEIIDPGPALPSMWAALVNPGVAMPTGPIFGAFDAANLSPPAPKTPTIENGLNFEDFAEILSRTKNDLQSFAISREPVIADVIEFLSHCPGAKCARMSGSGATSFALFDARDAAQEAAGEAQAKGWWAMAAKLASAAGD